MTIRKYKVFNYTTGEFEMLITSAFLEVGEFKKLPQGELQVIEFIYTF